MPFLRSSGILLHPTSFPSRFGIGDLGNSAYEFVDFLAESAQQYWQILPLSPCEDVPYVSYGSMAGNPLLISLERLRDEGLLSDGDFWHIPEMSADRVDFEQVKQIKLPLLQKAGENFKATASETQQKEFLEFCDRQAYWLDDYALFMALGEAFGGGWYEWKPGLSQRDPQAIYEWRRRLAGEIFIHKYWQFEFFRQWSSLKNYANERGIQIIGDLPIYVAHNSADVWANREIFCLDQNTHQPNPITGTPPDYFSATGQLWRVPVYNWEKLQQQNFRWWVQRFQNLLESVDLVRIDHFRAFQAYWAIAPDATTGIDGKWIEAPGVELFQTLAENLDNLPIIVEDLGTITPEVEALRDQFEFPGMKILQFAFDGDRNNPHLPLNYPRNCALYTGTHDNDTAVGWFEKLSAPAKQNTLKYLGCTSDLGIHWDLIRLAFSSVANQAIVPLQDLLGLSSEARMNTPSQIDGNWVWRYRGDALTEELRSRLKRMTETFGRAPIKF
jgi:4-alpha-glucanotransferase